MSMVAAGSLTCERRRSSPPFRGWRRAREHTPLEAPGRGLDSDLDRPPRAVRCLRARDSACDPCAQDAHRRVPLLPRVRGVAVEAMIGSLTPEALDELRRFVRAEIEAALRVHRDERRWLTVREAASYLGVSERAVRARIERGRIPTRRQGRSVLIDREALDRGIEKS